jgi:hypothetical protein
MPERKEVKISSKNDDPKISPKSAKLSKDWDSKPASPVLLFCFLAFAPMSDLGFP